MPSATVPQRDARLAPSAHLKRRAWRPNNIPPLFWRRSCLDFKVHVVLPHEKLGATEAAPKARAGRYQAGASASADVGARAVGSTSE